MMRALFSYFSRSRFLQWMCTSFAPARAIARRFIAGEELEDAVDVVRRLNGEGLNATLNELGENVDSREDSLRVVESYQKTLKRIHHEGLSADISVKPTHLGLSLGEEVFYTNLEAVLKTAASLDNAVEMDMEDSTTTTATLKVYHRLLDRHDNLRVALQAGLRRTSEDLKAIAARGGSVRIVKGAYNEPEEAAWKKMEEVNENYGRLIDQSFQSMSPPSSFLPAFGTHDHNLIQQALDVAEKLGISEDRYEFQMLLGVRRDWQRKLVGEGKKVRIYVPFGSHWYPYFMRRLAERPANALLIMRSMFSS